MTDSSLVNRFMAAVYMTETRFARLDVFPNALWQELEHPERGASDLYPVLNDYRSALSKRLPSTSRGAALDRLRERELTLISDVAGTEGVLRAPSTSKEIESAMCRSATAAHRLLTERGLSIEPTQVFVVDQLPEPYNNSDLGALAIDTGDEREYGTVPGVYFIRRNLRPFYSEFLLFHELFHVALGNHDPDRLAHGLEEGIAELMGSLWLSSNLLGEDMTRRLFVLNRLSSAYMPFWERYLDTTRFAFGMLLERGVEGMLTLVAEGRQKLYALEGRKQAAWGVFQLDGRVESKDAPFYRLATDLLLGYPRAWVTSPEAFLFAEHAATGLTVREVGAAAGLDKDLTRAAAFELRDDFSLIALRKDGLTIVEGEAAKNLSRTWLRYEPVDN